MEVEVTEQNGTYRAVDEETGTSVTAPSKEGALIALAMSLKAIQATEQAVKISTMVWHEIPPIIRQIQGEIETAIRTISDEMVQSFDYTIEQLPGAVGEEDTDDPIEGLYNQLSQDTQKHFDEEDVTEDDIDDAIEWARAQ